MKLLRTVFRGARLSWGILGISFALLLIVEVTSSVIVEHRQRSNQQSDSTWLGSELAGLEGFTEEAVESHNDFHTNSNAVTWEPYCYWRGRSFTGKHINVDSQGLRYTPQSLDRQPLSGNPTKLFMFGGSTMWGAYVPDNATIPAFVSRMLCDDGSNVQVCNFGQIGYVSTQEYIALVRECQKGNVPDIVVFYDGVNDTVSLHQHCESGLSINAENRRKEFNLLLRGTAKRHLEQLLRNTAIARLFTPDSPSNQAQDLSAIWQRHFERRKTDPLVAQLIQEIASTHAPDDVERRVAQLLVDDKVIAMLACYASNVRMIRALGRDFGFETYFFWQPVIFTKRSLAPSEKGIARDLGDAQLIYQAVDERLRWLMQNLDDERLRRLMQNLDDESSATLAALANVIYLGDVFDGPHWGKRQAFRDICHVTSDANALIAREMYNALRQTESPDVEIGRLD